MKLVTTLRIKLNKKCTKTAIFSGEFNNGHYTLLAVSAGSQPFTELCHVTQSAHLNGQVCITVLSIFRNLHFHFS